MKVKESAPVERTFTLEVTESELLTIATLSYHHEFGNDRNGGLGSALYEALRQACPDVVPITPAARPITAP